MRSLLTSLALVVVFSTAALAAEDQAIKDRVAEFQSAWNKHDPAAMAAVWAEDGSLVNPFGATADGRAEVQKVFVEEQAHPFKVSTYQSTDLRIQWVTADVAVADLTGKITGALAPDGSAAPDFTHHVTWVFVKKDGRWMAAAARAFQFAPRPGEQPGGAAKPMGH